MENKENSRDIKKIGGTWGCHISWNNPEDFGNGAVSIDPEKIYGVYGHLPTLPIVDELLQWELKRSFVYFRFLGVERPGDPVDLFFADVIFDHQEMKEC